MSAKAELRRTARGVPEWPVERRAPRSKQLRPPCDERVGDCGLHETFPTQPGIAHWLAIDPLLWCTQITLITMQPGNESIESPLATAAPSTLRDAVPGKRALAQDRRPEPGLQAFFRHYWQSNPSSLSWIATRAHRLNWRVAARHGYIIKRYDRGPVSFRPGLQLIEIFRPLFHHLPPFREMRCPIVSASIQIAYGEARV